jgi:endonuclease/exonuclease/phosphatase family metal-dependent hydrolase
MVCLSPEADLHEAQSQGSMKLSNVLNRKRILAFAIFGVLGLLFILNAYTARNYTDQNYPFYSGNFAVETSKPAETLTVVSYNIWFAENMDQALAELKEIRSEKGLDILLLQEMDESGTEHIARELQFNYVYFPAAIEPTYDKNFGNAILSGWPIVDPQKLILPHQSLSNRMNRIATKATIRAQGMDILVYSIHTESIFTLPRFKKDQYRAVLDDLRLEDQLVVIGGDFNTFTEEALKEIEDVYGQAGFLRVSEGSGHTIVKYGVEISSDHIFARGFAVEDAGKLAGATASDHLPIWVTLRFK